MILHRECKAGVHLQRPLSSGLGETGRGVPGLGDLQAHLAAAWGSGLNWMDCVPGEADYASGAWRVCFRPLPGFLSFFFFFFFSAEIVSAAHRAGVLQHLGILSPRAAWSPGLRFGTVVTVALCSFAFLQQELH